MNRKFIVVVPVFNSEKWIKECLLSIINQTYRNFELYILDDGSTDSTYDIINSLDYSNISGNIIHNYYNHQSPLKSIATLIRVSNCKGSDIIVTVDGDDKLANNDVLSRLNDIYQDSIIQLTYGQYRPVSGTYSDYCQPIEDFDNYRKSGRWVTSHLRTYTKRVWDMLDESDFLDVDGGYYKLAGDLAIMYPLLELCGPKRVKFISDVLYVYNDLNELNEMRKDSSGQVETEHRIRALNKKGRAVFDD